MHLTTITPARSINDDTHQASRNDAGHRQSDEPAHVDPRHKAPVDGPPRTRAKTNTDSSASNALGSRNRELCKLSWLALEPISSLPVVRKEGKGILTQPSSQNDRHRTAQLHRETSAGTLQCDAVSQVPHDIIPIRPQANDQARSAKHQNPNGHIGLALGRQRAVLPDLENGRVRTDGVGDVVGAVRETGRGSSHDLQKGVHVLGLVVVVDRVRVQLLDVGRDNGFASGLGGDDVLVDAAKQSPLDVPEENGARVPGTSGAGTDYGFDWGSGRLGGLVVVVRRGGGVLGDGGALGLNLLAVGGGSGGG